MVILDGPMGTELRARGVDTRLPLWSARALIVAPDIVAAVHREYAAAGATVHTANTFRTKRRTMPKGWVQWTRDAVAIARASVPASHRVAGSISPLEDCYRPDLSPGQASRTEHRELAEVLADAGCDLLLCETFPHPEEAIVAVEEAKRTSLETWLALTAGPNADLLTPDQLGEVAKRAVDAGASAVLANCIPARRTLEFVEALVGLGVPIGAYANAGEADENIGWRSAPEPGAASYAELAKEWKSAGAEIIGGCCGTSAAHIRALNSPIV